MIKQNKTEQTIYQLIRKIADDSKYNPRLYQITDDQIRNLYSEQIGKILTQHITLPKTIQTHG